MTPFHGMKVSLSQNSLVLRTSKIGTHKNSQPRLTCTTGDENQPGTGILSEKWTKMTSDSNRTNYINFQRLLINVKISSPFESMRFNDSSIIDN